MNFQPELLLVGPSPPPYNGMTLATDLVVKATEGRFTHVRLDTADRRGLANVGKFDLGNVYCALRDGVKFLWMLVTQWPRVVYVPVAQAWLPFLRDCLFLIPARLTGRVGIVHLHGSAFGKFYQRSSRVTRWIIRYALGNEAYGIVLGQGVKDVFDGIIAPERIQIIPNGIPDHFEDKNLDRADHSLPLLLFLGTLVAEKGFLDLLRALPRALERGEKFHAVFAGEWYSQEDKKAADEIVKAFGLGQTVQFVGPVGPHQKQELLLKADLFVFPSTNEGQPYVILEAMSAGLSVISTKVGCIPEMVQDGVNGFLIEPGDVEKLAERIEILIRDRALRNRMGAAGRERFLREFTFDIFAQRMLRIFEKAIAKPTPANEAPTWTGEQSIARSVEEKHAD